jgi:hypothetical protein
MTPYEIGQLVLGAGVLAVAWRAVDGFLKQKARDSKNTGLAKRVGALELELSKLPEPGELEGHVEELKRTVDRLVIAQQQDFTQINHLTLKLPKLITAEAGEKIINQVNACTLHVDQLLEWQRDTQKAAALEGLIGENG